MKSVQNLNNKITLFLWCLILALSGYYAFTHINLETNILKLLPKYKSATTSALIDKAATKINDKLIIAVSHTSQEQARTQFLETIEKFNKSELFVKISSSIDSEQFQQIYQQLQPYRYLLMAKIDRLAMQESLGFEYFTDMAKSELYGLGNYSQEQLATDTLFFFHHYINQLSDFNPLSIESDNGLFYREKDNKYHYFAFIQLKSSAFLPEYQQKIADLIANSSHKNQLKNVDLHAFGSVLYAHQAYLEAKGEISTVGFGSLIGIFLLFLITFRSLLPLFVSIISIGLGLVFAFAVSSFVFGKLHLFALVFGSTIAGVSIDYCFHYLCESAISDHKYNNKIIAHILPGLSIAFGSSALVYLGFVLTGYEVLAQISLFSICGLLAVLLNVLILFPRIVNPKTIQNTHVMVKLAKLIINNPLSRFLNSFVRISLLFFAVLLLNFYFLKPNDDVRDLQSLSKKLKKDETSIKKVLSLKDNGRYVLIYADSISQLLNLEAEVLSQIRQQDDSIIGVSDLIPSQKQQQINQSFYKNLYASDEFKNYVAEIGIDQNIFNQHRNQINKVKQINYDIFDHDIIKNTLSQRWLGKVDEVYALAIPLTEHLEIMTNEKVLVVEQAKDASQLFKDFRIKSEFIVMLSALILIFLLSIFRYKLKTAIQIVLLPFSAGLLALLLTHILGFHISLFSILALLLILGMGLDYVVFLKEAKNITHVGFALLLSSITTILSFGLLSLSHVAVIKSFGLTVALGIFIILLISPAILKKQQITD